MAPSRRAGRCAVAASGPNLVTPRDWSGPVFKQAGAYSPRFDLRTDFVMAYGISGDVAERLKAWSAAGYVLHLMTGVAWGDYGDYLDGKFDGRRHWDEAQTDAAGKPIWHHPGTPYMVPSVAFAAYLEQGLAQGDRRRAWSPSTWRSRSSGPAAGFSEAFQPRVADLLQRAVAAARLVLRRPVPRQQAEVLSLPPHARPALLVAEGIRLGASITARCGSTCPRIA